MKSRKKENNNIYLIDSFPFNRLLVILQNKTRETFDFYDTITSGIYDDSFVQGWIMFQS